MRKSTVRIQKNPKMCTWGKNISGYRSKFLGYVLPWVNSERLRGFSLTYENGDTRKSTTRGLQVAVVCTGFIQNSSRIFVHGYKIAGIPPQLNADESNFLSLWQPSHDQILPSPLQPSVALGIGKRRQPMPLWWWWIHYEHMIHNLLLPSTNCVLDIRVT